MPAVSSTAIGHGDRFVYLGRGRRHGKHGTVIAARRGFANVRFDDGLALLCLARDCHPIPRRPPPMW
ncbi:hypothetical protein [Sphingomonas phyllosphaerae]|uniref:hypothetical protein n=1 Tax=Sphingomonas phyllosphaerae TaxID=257003 RepID=UPI000405D2EA|nr:hypothetical protein [Sphingomonas phyllosphaerae]